MSSGEVKESSDSNVTTDSSEVKNETNTNASKKNSITSSKEGAGLNEEEKEKTDEEGEKNVTNGSGLNKEEKLKRDVGDKIVKNEELNRNKIDEAVARITPQVSVKDNGNVANIEKGPEAEINKSKKRKLSEDDDGNQTEDKRPLKRSKLSENKTGLTKETFSFFSSFAKKNPFSTAAAAGSSSSFSFAKSNTTSFFNKPSSSLSKSSTTLTSNQPTVKEEQDCSTIFPNSNTPVVTGEESEKVVFQIRTKLFINSTKKEKELSWKEVGIGPMRILKQKNKHYRMVQRRETHPHSTQSTKLLLNISITEYTKVSRNAEKFVSMAFLEPSGVISYLCRFQNMSDADSFENKVQEIITEMKETKDA